MSEDFLVFCGLGKLCVILQLLQLPFHVISSSRSTCRTVCSLEVLWMWRCGSCVREASEVIHHVKAKHEELDGVLVAEQKNPVHQGVVAEL